MSREIELKKGGRKELFVSSHCFSLTPSDESKWQPSIPPRLLLLRCQQVVARVRSADGRGCFHQERSAGGSVRLGGVLLPAKARR